MFHTHHSGLDLLSTCMYSHSVLYNISQAICIPIYLHIWYTLIPQWRQRSRRQLPPFLAPFPTHIHSAPCSIFPSTHSTALLGCFLPVISFPFSGLVTHVAEALKVAPRSGSVYRCMKQVSILRYPSRTASSRGGCDYAEQDFLKERKTTMRFLYSYSILSGSERPK